MSRSEDVAGVSQAPGVRVFECGPAERAEQAELFNACFKKTLDARALTWRYDANPHGASVSFVQRPPDGRAISGYACSPRWVVSRGDRAHAKPVGETGDVMTHPDWRNRGLFSALDRAAMAATEKRGWAHVFGLPNRKSAHIFLKLGWSQVGTIRTWTFVLANDAFAREFRSREGRIAGWTTPLAAWRAARGLARLHDRRPSFSHTGGGVRVLERFPDAVDALSAVVEARYAWMVRRDAAYLNWRFCAAPSGVFEVLGAFDGDGRFHGYAVIQKPKPNEPIGYLVDALAAEPLWLSAVLHAALERLSELNASIVRASAIDGSWWSKQLARAGFVRPKSDNHLIVIAYTHVAHSAQAQAARDASTWYFTDGDRDDETMG
jgi:GNAT superfamily N-acetyltransferase